MRKKQNYYYILSTRVFIHIVVCTDYYCWLPFFSIGFYHPDTFYFSVVLPLQFLFRVEVRGQAWSYFNCVA